MKHTFLAVLAVLLLATAMPASAHEGPPGGKFKKVSTLVKLPEFVPGLGVLYVDPSTLPAGPFLAYDKTGRLVSTVYMIPLDALDAHKSFDDLGVGSAAKGHKVDHVDMYYDAGHPGVEKPHYHVILWYIPAAEAAALK